MMHYIEYTFLNTLGVSLEKYLELRSSVTSARKQNIKISRILIMIKNSFFLKEGPLEGPLVV